MSSKQLLDSERRVGKRKWKREQLVDVLVVVMMRDVMSMIVEWSSRLILHRNDVAHTQTCKRVCGVEGAVVGGSIFSRIAWYYSESLLYSTSLERLGPPMRDG